MVVLVVIVALVVAAGYGVYYHVTTTPPNASVNYSMVNLTGDLGNAFDPGSIQAFGSNSSSILLSGVGYTDKTTQFSNASLLRLNSLQPGSTGTELSRITADYFHNGTVFGTGWNGTAWLLTGETGFNGTSQAGVIAVEGSYIDNLTATIGHYFRDGGAWIDAWNGSGWLIGGNSDTAAVLVGYYHGEIINYTSALGPLPLHSWIQLIDFNSSAWLVGGHGVFGFLSSGHFTNMLSRTAFAFSGVYSAQFTGGRWIIGGGPPAGIQIISGNSVESAVSTPSFFNSWVNGICIYDNSYFIGGKGLHSNRFYPALYKMSVSSSGISFQNLSSLLPSSFEGGQVQFMSTISFQNYTGILIAGQGNYNATTAFSTGALAFLTRNVQIGISYVHSSHAFQERHSVQSFGPAMDPASATHHFFLFLTRTNVAIAPAVTPTPPRISKLK